MQQQEVLRQQQQQVVAEQDRVIAATQKDLEIHQELERQRLIDKQSAPAQAKAPAQPPQVPMPTSLFDQCKADLEAKAGVGTTIQGLEAQLLSENQNLGNRQNHRNGYGVRQGRRSGFEKIKNLSIKLILLLLLRCSFCAGLENRPSPITCHVLGDAALDCRKPFQKKSKKQSTDKNPPETYCLESWWKRWRKESRHVETCWKAPGRNFDIEGRSSSAEKSEPCHLEPENVMDLDVKTPALKPDEPEQNRTADKKAGNVSAPSHLKNGKDKVVVAEKKAPPNPRKATKASKHQNKEPKWLNKVSWKTKKNPTAKKFKKMSLGCAKERHKV